MTSQIPDECDLQISTSEDTFKQVLAGLQNPVTAIASQEITVNKNVEFIQFLSKFTP